MLPLSYKDKRVGFLSRVKDKLYSWKRLIFADKNTRNLFLFLILNLSFAFVELFYGIMTNSLGNWPSASDLVLWLLNVLFLQVLFRIRFTCSLTAPDS